MVEAISAIDLRFDVWRAARVTLHAVAAYSGTFFTDVLLFLHKDDLDGRSHYPSTPAEGLVRNVISNRAYSICITCSASRVWSLLVAKRNGVEVEEGFGGVSTKLSAKTCKGIFEEKGYYTKLIAPWGSYCVHQRAKRCR